jgi:hypothetical protein
MMAVALWMIAVLMLASVIYLKKFMDDMAAVESELIQELRQIKGVLVKINEKQL